MDELIDWENPPPPPFLGKVTHCSVELIWNEDLLNSSKCSSSQHSLHETTLCLSGSTTSFRSHSVDPSRMKYIVQEEEIGGLITKGFGTVSIIVENIYLYHNIIIVYHNIIFFVAF